MDILYSAILQGSQPVAEWARNNRRKHNGVDLRTLATAIADQAKPGEKVCVSVSRLMGYYSKQQSSGLVIVAIAEETASQRMLLQSIKGVDAKLKAGTSDRAKVLEEVHAELIQNQDSIQLANSEINDVKQVLINNVDLLLERGERVNLLVDRTGDMSQSANIFNRQATQLQRRMWFQNVKLVAVGGVLLVGGALVAVKIL